MKIKGKKGQGISVNTIIIAAIALVVLVVLIAIFTGRFAVFQQTVSEEAETELATMRINYGTCHPNNAAEQSFLQELSAAENEQGKAEVKDAFQAVISACKNADSCPTAGISSRANKDGTITGGCAS